MAQRHNLTPLCLPLDPRFVGSNVAKGNGFLMVIKISNKPSLGRVVKPSSPCCKNLWHVKDPFEI
jgi:hypothetical protein